MLSHIMLLVVRGEDFAMAANVMKKINNQAAYIGEANIEAMCAFMEKCIVNNDFDKAMVSHNNCLIPLWTLPQILHNIILSYHWKGPFRQSYAPRFSLK